MFCLFRLIERVRVCSTQGCGCAMQIVARLFLSILHNFSNILGMSAECMFLVCVLPFYVLFVYVFFIGYAPGM